MNAIRRGFRNVFRNGARSALVLLIVAMSVAVGVGMLQVRTLAASQLRALQATVENMIEVRAAGATNMGQGAELLPESIVDQVKDLPNIRGIERYLLVREVDTTKEPPITITVGVQPVTAKLRVATHGEANDPKVTVGRGFRAEDAGKNVAILGRIFAANRGITPENFRPGTKLELKGEQVEIVGLFVSGFSFGDNQLFLPMETAQRLYKAPGKIANFWVTVDSTENLSEVASQMKQRLAGRVDVIAGEENVKLINQALGQIQASTSAGAALATAVGGLVVLFTMILVSLERTGEVGLLKALGGSDREVALQFLGETVGLALAGGLLGLLVLPVVGPALNRLVASASLEVSMGAGQVINVQPAGGWNGTAIVLSLGLALVFAALGSLFPMYRAGRMRPADALKYE